MERQDKYDGAHGSFSAAIYPDCVFTQTLSQCHVNAYYSYYANLLCTFPASYLLFFMNKCMTNCSLTDTIVQAGHTSISFPPQRDV